MPFNYSTPVGVPAMQGATPGAANLGLANRNSIAQALMNVRSPPPQMGGVPGGMTPPGLAPGGMTPPPQIGGVPGGMMPPSPIPGGAPPLPPTPPGTGGPMPLALPQQRPMPPASPMLRR